ncbi:cation transporter [Lysobacter sp. H21R4]|uniref:cation transporter n=1 Tax=Lysobacter sp. H21R4 TaxID=2781021 RepID=UPI001888E972|nr:cation transporter [Lysobacter sp. H21R4]QOY62665.1 cation transporter [Lysobacter sp. H21R4]
MSGKQLEIRSAGQRTILWIVLGLNLALAAAFGVTGLKADSSALIANGLDNASDSIVYIITLLALTRPPVWKRGAARVSGGLLILFAAGVLFDVARRFLSDVEPVGSTMMVMAVVAAAVNLLCVWLLKKIQGADVNVRAATTFSTNDFVANAGVLVGGGLVLWTGQAWPDLVVGVAVAGVALKGAIVILHDAHHETDKHKEHVGE